MAQGPSEIYETCLAIDYNTAVSADITIEVYCEFRMLQGRRQCLLGVIFAAAFAQLPHLLTKLNLIPTFVAC
jgi:hypothetical protein